MTISTQPFYSIRPATDDDLPAIVNLLNDCEEADTGLRPVAIEDVQQDWSSPQYDVNLSVRVVTDSQGKIIAYASFWDLEKPAVDPWLDLHIHPDYRATSASDMLVEWGEERTKLCVAEVPEEMRVALFSGARQAHTNTKALFVRRGFEEARHFWKMKIDLDQQPQAPVWPGGFQLIHFHTKEEVEVNLEKIVTAVDDSFQDHFGYVSRPIDQAVEQWKHNINNDKKRFDPKLWYLAMDGEEIAALCLCMKEDFEDPNNGHVNILGVRRPYRRKGLGLALLLHSFQEYYRRGKTAVSLGVDADSITNATKLYEKAGMHVERQFDDYEKGIRSGKDLVRRE